MKWNLSGRPHLAARNELDAEARRRYLEMLARNRLKAKGLFEEFEEIPLPSEQMKAEAVNRFRLANPAATDDEIEACWESVCEDLARRRAQQSLEILKIRLRALVS